MDKRELNRLRCREYRKKNLELFARYQRDFKKKYPERHAAQEAKRRAVKLKRTPCWANLGNIKIIYINCPKGFHVDHIIPLCGKNVCGLHVENNLQYLPAIDNLKKANCFG